MGFQGLAPLIQGNGVLEIDLALLQACDDCFKLRQGAFKAQIFDGTGWSGYGNDNSPGGSWFCGAPKTAAGYSQF